MNSSLGCSNGLRKMAGVLRKIGAIGLLRLRLGRLRVRYYWVVFVGNQGYRYYLALGANKGDREGALRMAVEDMARMNGLEVRKVSPVYENAAHTLGEEKQPDFLNAVAEVYSRLDPDELLICLQEIERKAGRDASAERWAPRELDLDILMCGEITLDTADLKLPHPRIAERRFVLQPLADLDPDLNVPSPFNASVNDLLSRCRDQNPLRRLPIALEVR